MSKFFELIFEIFFETVCMTVGHYFWWNLSGRKNTFLSYVNEDKHHFRDGFTGIIIILSIIFLIAKIIWPENF